VQKYVSMTNHMWDGLHFLINGGAWRALPQQLQDVLARNINAAALKEREISLSPAAAALIACSTRQL
jgi:TRAP-type transport system periplasmic protein